MNETDVREEIVRPLLSRLGYAHGTENNVQTEVQLRYSYRILGHPKPGKDHPMRGIADYLCSVVSYARWTIEVKAPSVELGEEEWAQAHSYACHPEIAATHFLVTNGKVFRLYSMLEPKTPILEWIDGETNRRWIEIQNVLSPAQIRARFVRERDRVGKALALGLGAKAEVVGGYLEYAQYETEHSEIKKTLDQLDRVQRAAAHTGTEDPADDKHRRFLRGCELAARA